MEDLKRRCREIYKEEALARRHTIFIKEIDFSVKFPPWKYLSFEDKKIKIKDYIKIMNFDISLKDDCDSYKFNKIHYFNNPGIIVNIENISKI